MSEIETRMTWLFVRTAAKAINERLPGWEAFLANDPKAAKHMSEKEETVLTRFADEDEVLFTKALQSWTKSWERINEVIAERYRVSNSEPELWQLRYIKWMKIVYIHFTSKKGEFYLLPRRPKKKPRVKHWYTVDEMTDMLHPTIAAAIQLSDVLPMRPESTRGPAAKEKHLHIDTTGKETKVYYKWGDMSG